jgi:Ice-binding-like
MRRAVSKARFLSVVVFAILAGVWPVAAQAATAPGLGSAAGFAVLAGTALTCTDSNVAGPVGVNFTTAFASTRCNMQVQFAPGAFADFGTAFTNGLGTCDTTFAAPTLGSTTLAGGVYCFPAALTMTSATLTLTGTGPWNFEIGTSGTGALTATSLTVVSTNPCNVFWWVHDAVTTTDSAFQGTILGGGAITLTRTSLEGRAFATGAMTMTGSNIFGCNAAGTVAQHHCNQGVGNGPEGCDPGNSNQGNPSRSNDELGGTPGNPGRKGGNRK